MKRILSGIRANSDLTLGNYLGALKPWVELQDVSDQNTEYFFFVPNLHSLVGRPDASQLAQNTLSNVAWFLAAGLDPAKVTLFVQSHVSAHAELAWIFNNYVTMGELNRMTQFKDKTRKAGAEGQLVGLYTYPTLMAADILLYDTNEVPVGDDQHQHVELTRTIADRFNNLYSAIFTLPKAVSPIAGARIMNLQDPTAKMSKSDEDTSGNLLLSDSPNSLRHKIKRAITDSGSDVSARPDKPAISNLLQIFSAVSGRPIAKIAESYTDRTPGYGEFKEELAEVLINHIEPIQERYHALIADSAKLNAIIEEGNFRANQIAIRKLVQVKTSIGLL